MTDNTAADFPTVDFWRSLRYFNLYRLMLAGIFVFLAEIFSSSLSLGTHNWKTFSVSSLLSAVATAASFVLLLLVSRAAAGLISRGRTTLFFAALASIAMLLEHTYAVLQDGADVAQYVQVGLLCMAYFAVAWLAHTLAKYAVDSQLLAQRRGRDLVSLSEANRLVM